MKGILKGVWGGLKDGVRGSRSIMRLATLQGPAGYLQPDLRISRLDDSGQDDKFTYCV